MRDISINTLIQRNGIVSESIIIAIFLPSTLILLTHLFGVIRRPCYHRYIRCRRGHHPHKANTERQLVG